MEEKELRERFAPVINALGSFSYSDWLKLKQIIDKKFQKREGEFKRQLKLSATDFTEPYSFTI